MLKKQKQIHFENVQISNKALDTETFGYPDVDFHYRRLCVALATAFS